MDDIQLQLEQYTINANAVKELVLNKLLFNKHITPEQFHEYDTQWGIVIFKNKWFTKWINLFNKEQNAWTYKFIKLE